LLSGACFLLSIFRFCFLFSLGVPKFYIMCANAHTSVVNRQTGKASCR
jgi:hypothetical protein